MRMRASYGLLCLIILFGNLSCSVNILENFAKKDTDEAYYYDAMKLINKGRYQDALDVMNKMSTAYGSSRKIINLKASAHGGLCGINFLSFVEDFSNLSGNLFTFLLAIHPGGTLARADSCRVAEDLLKSIGNGVNRTNDENVLMMVLGFSKIGNILNHYADTDGDGVPDAGYDVCADAAATDISDDYAREIGTGVTLAMESLTQIASSINLGSGSLTSLDGVCTALSGIGMNFCSVTDATAFTALEVRGIRTLLKESTILGLGANCTGDVTACFCM